MRTTQATNTLAARTLRAALLAAILIGLAVPLLAPRDNPAPATPAPAAHEFVVDGDQFDSAESLQVEHLDVETLRRIIHAPSVDQSRP